MSNFQPHANCCGGCDKNPHQALINLNAYVRNSTLRDAVGPFPDEVIMLALDWILYFLGATKIFHLFKQPANQCSDEKKACHANTRPLALPGTKLSATSFASQSELTKLSNTSLSDFVSAKSRTSSIQQLIPPPPRCCHRKVTTLKPKIVRCTVPCSRPRQRSPRVDFANPAIDDRQLAGGISIADRLKYSMSVCSSAYHRFKNKLSKGVNEQWLWTRLIKTANGHQIYEVYKKSDMKRKGHDKKPLMIFLILPNGDVMPFETL